jgi:hypothetical protein
VGKLTKALVHSLRSTFDIRNDNTNSLLICCPVRQTKACFCRLQARIAEIMRAGAERAEVTVEQVVRELKLLGFSVAKRSSAQFLPERPRRDAITVSVHFRCGAHGAAVARGFRSSQRPMMLHAKGAPIIRSFLNFRSN